MSARHPRPWRAVLETTVRERRADGRRGFRNVEYWAVLDARDAFLTQGLDEQTAREIAQEDVYYTPPAALAAIGAQEDPAP